MRNLEHPLPQTMFEYAQELLTLRYIGALDRLDDPERSFTTYVHQEALKTLLIEPLDNSEMTATTTAETVFLWTQEDQPCLEKSVQSIRKRARELDPYAPADNPAVTLAILKQAKEILPSPGLPIHKKLEMFAMLGVIAGRVKPPQERAMQLAKRQAPDETPEETVFRKAVALLQANTLKPGEEKAISRKMARYDAAIAGNRKGNFDKILPIMNKYYQGQYVENVLERLLSEQTLARDVRDDIIVSTEEIDEPPVVQREADEPAPVILVPWPMLPPTFQGETRGSIEKDSSSQETADDSPPPNAGERLRVYHHLTAWIGALVGGWEYGGRTVEVDLPTGNVNEEYRGALLNDADGSPFILIADTALGDNALYYAVEGEVHDEHGNPVPLLEVFKGNKPRARELGAKYVHHRGQDFHRSVMDIIITKALERM